MYLPIVYIKSVFTVVKHFNPKLHQVIVEDELEICHNLPCVYTCGRLIQKGRAWGDTSFSHNGEDLLMIRAPIQCNKNSFIILYFVGLL